ncbi:MAG: Stage sporulation family protein, partial [Paenibacillus sp.]|nr:Stage sporulation family protein [Paenibacillus sp.]
MSNRAPRQTDRSILRNNPLYDSGVAKVSAFAALLLVISIVLTGTLGYFITKEQTVKKLKDNDLVYIASSITEKINGSIGRAVETAQLLALDRQTKEWILAGEPEEGGENVGTKVAVLKDRFNYDSSFIVTVPKRHYWSESGRQVSTMSETEPNDAWFFNFLKSGKKIDIAIDYNKERKDTFVFINVLMEENSKPLAIVGVGFSLSGMSGKFEEYKFGKKGSLWITDNTGTHQL